MDRLKLGGLVMSSSKPGCARPGVNRFFTVWTDGQVMASDAAELSHRQWTMASVQLSHRYTLVPCPVMFPPPLVLQWTAL